MVIVPLAVQLFAGCDPPLPIVPGINPTSFLSIPTLLSPFPSPPKGSPAFPIPFPSPWLPAFVPRPLIRFPIAAFPLPSPFPVFELAVAAPDFFVFFVAEVLVEVFLLSALDSSLFETEVLALFPVIILSFASVFWFQVVDPAG